MTDSISPHSQANIPGLPLVVHVGFAGSRFLFDATAHPQVDANQFVAAVQRHLNERLKTLPQELGLSPRHFVCGLSQLAIGADTLFTRACQALNWAQRLLLPQLTDQYLAATSSNGTPDFTSAQAEEARGLMHSAHIIETRVVSDSADRHNRFYDVSLEILREADLLVCLVDAAAPGKPAGTRELIKGADQRNLPVLVISLVMGPEGQPSFSEEWLNRKAFVLPALPNELAGLTTQMTGFPGAEPYYDALKRFISTVARRKQGTFTRAALIIILFHVLATGIALYLALAGAGSHHVHWGVPAALFIELLLLVTGFGVHEYLHHSRAAGVWAMARLVAEVARSANALLRVPNYLRHLFSLPLPASLRYLLRTINVVHLASTRSLAQETWERRRQEYIQLRLTQAPGGQIPYYTGRLHGAERWHRVARWAFLMFSGGAILATLGKFLLKLLHLLDEHGWMASDAARAWVAIGQAIDPWSAGLGAMAIFLPVLAVAALSLAASFDLDARAHTYHEMLAFLQLQKERLKHAATERAFANLVFETESRLLGETVSWYSRRAYTGVI